MQGRSQLADKFPVVRLILVRHLLEIDHDARLVRFHRVLHRIANQIRARRRIRQHLHHFLHMPRRAVVVIQHRHRRNFHVDAAHPLVQLVFPQPAVRFLRAHLHGFIPHVIHNRQRAIRRYRVKLFRYQKVDVFVVAFQRRQAIRVVADVKRRPQRVVPGRHRAQIRHAPVPAFAHWRQFPVLFYLQRAIGRLRVGNQSSRQINADHDGHKKIDE